MEYTVKELAELSGVSVRTLHWYDHIDLLKPAYTAANNYRYYGKNELLLLQQILFFRELGFSLKDIQAILESDDFDKIKTLEAHKASLEAKLDRSTQLIKTVEKTLKHLKEKADMSENEYYEGFDATKQDEYEHYLMEYKGTVAEDLILESKKRTKAWDKQDWSDVKEEGNAIYAALTAHMAKDLNPRDEPVQKEIHKHFQMIARFYDPTKDVYMGLAQLYCEHPDFRQYYEKFHPKLAEYIAEAMRVYAMENL